jgi:tryptophan-rich sensory protein
MWSAVLLLLGPVIVASAVARLSPPPTTYDQLRKPPWSPKPWVFPAVWTILYLLMGYASARVASKAGWATLPIALYVTQLVLNLAWTPVFFGLERYQAALWLIRAILVATVMTLIAFAEIDTVASLLMVPYVAWLGVAHQLNQSIVELNSI